MRGAVVLVGDSQRSFRQQLAGVVGAAPPRTGRVGRRAADVGRVERDTHITGQRQEHQVRDELGAEAVRVGGSDRERGRALVGRSTGSIGERCTVRAVRGGARVVGRHERSPERGRALRPRVRDGRARQVAPVAVLVLVEHGEEDVRSRVGDRPALARPGRAGAELADDGAVRRVIDWAGRLDHAVLARGPAEPVVARRGPVQRDP